MYSLKHLTIDLSQAELKKMQFTSPFVHKLLNPHASYPENLIVVIDELMNQLPSLSYTSVSVSSLISSFVSRAVK